MTRLVGTLLPRERMADVYPLIRAVSGVSSRRWAAFGHRLFHRGGAIMAVVDDAERIYGAAAFHKGSTLRYPSSLIVEALAAFELSNNGRVKRQLCAALRQEAATRQCSTLVLQSMSANSTGTIVEGEGWNALGMAIDAVTIVQDLTGPTFSTGSPAQSRK